MSSPNHWPSAALQQTLRPLLPELNVEVVSSIDSTNSELSRRIAAGNTTPTLLVAESQTAGRGRLGRRWETGNDGTALCFSLAMPLAPTDWSGLSLAVGVTVAEALHPAIGLKWPNDLWCQRRKLGGILIETKSTATAPQRMAVVGIGINIQQPRSLSDFGDRREPSGKARPVLFDFEAHSGSMQRESGQKWTASPTGVADRPEVRQAPGAITDLRIPPVGLQELLPHINAAQALQRIAPPLVAAMRTFEREGFVPFQAPYAARDVLAGGALQLSDGRQGIGRGVADNGALLIETAHGVETVTSSEVSVRPATVMQTSTT